VRTAFYSAPWRVRRLCRLLPRSGWEACAILMRVWCFLAWLPPEVTSVGCPADVHNIQIPTGHGLRIPETWRVVWREAWRPSWRTFNEDLRLGLVIASVESVFLLGLVLIFAAHASSPGVHSGKRIVLTTSAECRPGGDQFSLR